MTDRPILRLPEPTYGDRLKGSPDKRPRPRGAGRQIQAARFDGGFRRLEEAIQRDDPEMVLRQDPGGIAPERALVFETIVPIQRLQNAVEEIGLELLMESDLPDYEIPEALVDEFVETAKPTLYATMPSREALKELLRLWKTYQSGEKAPRGLGPFWKLFGMLADIRVWGPQDRLTPEARRELLLQLSEDDAEPVRFELEIWPTASSEKRGRWQRDAQARVEALGGGVVMASSIDQDGFVYEAVLVDMPSGTVRTMLDNPSASESLATVDGLQFVLPQTIGQSLPGSGDDLPDDPGDEFEDLEPFDANAPIRVVMLDGVPVAGHPALDGGVEIEDIHDIVPLSQVQNRRHATSMASLILRGDLVADGVPLAGSRLLAIPVLVDTEHGATSPNDRLFVDMVHSALAAAFLGDEPLAPDAFIVNFSIGVRGSHFAGRISSLARQLDWWADNQGILFMVSAGNIPIDEALVVSSMTFSAFEACSLDEKIDRIEEARRNARHERTLLEPAEAVNVLTVGAADEDLVPRVSPVQPGTVSLARDHDIRPAVSSANGLGVFRSIKPDYIHTGGLHDLRISPDDQDIRLRVQNTIQTGLHVAAVGQGAVLYPRHRDRGTSCSTALATRAHVNAVTELIGDDGPYDGETLGRRDFALITKALAVNAARWPESAVSLYNSELARLQNNHAQAREEVCRYYGHGCLDPFLMREAPSYGATMVGVGTIRKDRAVRFRLPLPPSLAGERIGRSMWVTVAWFSPVLPTRARYRLALLEALPLVPNSTEEAEELVKSEDWHLDMKVSQLDANIIKRGTVWSKRLVHAGQSVPDYDGSASFFVGVQCRDASGGGLPPDEDIRFAIAITLELETQTQFDIHEEIQNALRIRLRDTE